MTFSPRSIAVVLSALAASVAVAVEPATRPANTKPAATKPAAAKAAAKPKPTQRHQQIDQGPFVTATITNQWEEQGITNKGIAVRLDAKDASGKPLLGPDGKPIGGGVLFDTDTCRTAAAWTGGFIDFTRDWTNVRDSKSVKIVGKQFMGTHVGPGWAKPGTVGDDAWKDPRPQGFGPLPHSWLKYKGVYRLNGGFTAFAYSVGNCDVIDMPLEKSGIGDLPGRALEIGASDQQAMVLVAQRAGATARVTDTGVAVLESGEDATAFVAMGSTLPKETKWLADQTAAGGRLVLSIPPRTKPATLTIHTWSGKAADVAAQVSPLVTQRDQLRALPESKNIYGVLTELTGHGSRPLWPDVITTAGQLGQPRDKNAPYIVDTITLPDDNPWKSWMRPGGFDFFTSDPTRAAICNWSGDVWTVSGITGDLKELKWRRIASGLFQPLGLRIVNDQIYVIGRDQITKLVDLNGDGETDFYQSFNNDMEVTPNFHEFTFGLETDKAGNFYCAKAGPVRNGGRGFDQIAAHHGSILKISPDGQTLERYATGFRAPTGFGVGPDGQVTAGDNEGSWVPKCRLAWVKAGGFYGVVPTAHRDTPPTDYDRPLCWFPKNIDNSSGGQTWVTSNQWGPFENRLLHLSYGTCSLFLAMKQDVAGVPNATVQGGVVRFPLSFDSGIMRARFNPADGQLYVAGLKGWQTSAGKDGCFQRVRYTGKTVHMPTAIEATKTGLTITFTCKLSAEEANDPQSYAIERWNYLWAENYGSADYSVSDPTKSAHDTVKIKSAKLQPDGKTVVLEIPDMKPAMQYKTEVNLVSEDDADVRFEIYHTVHGF
ncbi:DUF6797 domain-containing protein [Humisphaera borealis]|uniref:DUF6797 domain-containing protein n=1 Tax=Humisphaera borealis TaxID=2807512 RepID=A0A7M2WWJ8_9BACT|nr:DUF6797 domain-containing protein [Humisphaera borealis]QOV89846.1 hypothetical protein IPV69_00280 [Humisphaera borealis]